MEIVKLRIKKSGEGNPPYWYENHIGDIFFCEFKADGGTHVGNGFPLGVFTLIPGMNSFPYHNCNNLIRPEDVRVIVG